MSSIWRRLRGVASTGSTWFVAWAGLGVLYLAVDYMRNYWQVPELRSQFLEALAAFGLFWGVWGAASGIIYGVCVAVTQRSQMFDQLRARHLAFWGAMAGAAYPAVLWAASFFAPSPWLADAPIGIALGAAAGAISAAGTLWIARRADRVPRGPTPAELLNAEPVTTGLVDRVSDSVRR